MQKRENTKNNKQEEKGKQTTQLKEDQEKTIIHISYIYG
jgi:hypothetical protein